jgi:uncharacterized lipoprotein YddW (UPF0748 family)
LLALATLRADEPVDVAAGGGHGLGLEPEGGGTTMLAPSAAPTPGLVPLPDPRLAPSVEFRGSWVHWEDYRSPEAIARTVARARRAGLNVLLPLANYPHQAMWRGAVLPVNPQVAPGFDPLRELVRQGHRAGLQIHPYLVMLNAGLSKPPGTDPAWYVLDTKGQRVGGWLNAAHPGVREYLTGLVADLAATGVDGIQYDYMRHEYNTDYDYSDFTRNLFLAEHGFDPLGLRQGGLGSAEVWDQWRTAQVTELARRCSLAARRVNPELVLSAAGGTQRDDLAAVRRDGRTWLQRGIVDFVCPMAYLTDEEAFRRRLQRELEPLEDPRLRQVVFSGLGFYKFPDQPQRLVRQVQIARAAGLRGMCVFAFEHLSEAAITQLAAGPFQQPARVPWKAGA